MAGWDRDCSFLSVFCLLGFLFLFFYLFPVSDQYLMLLSLRCCIGKTSGCARRQTKPCLKCSFKALLICYCSHHLLETAGLVERLMSATSYVKT